MYVNFPTNNRYSTSLFLIISLILFGGCRKDDLNAESGDEGVIDIEDTHRDLVLASTKPQGHGYNPSGFEPSAARHVDFLTSYPPGDIYNNQLYLGYRQCFFQP